MATDTQLSRHFRLSSFPCWELATPADALNLRWTVLNLLQPTADRWGPLTVTSWRRWTRNDCADLRTGDHADAGTVDFVPQRATVEQVWNWMGGELRGKYGSLINERDHIHVTRPGVGVAPGTSEFLYEPTEGVYVASPLPGKLVVLASVAVAGLYLLNQQRTRGR